MLNRWFQIEGPIVSGAGRGRTLTVPTLNIFPLNELIPKIGVYVTRISIDGGPFRESITNVGVRPTFGEHELTVETFVMEGAVPVAAAFARVQFLRRLRNEMKFGSPEALRQQINIDVERCRKFFRLLNNVHHAGHSN
jgi:riboflavin kinase/FMN adenylyltransferase